MELAQWLSLATVCLLGAMSPGPSLAVVMNNTLANGPSAGYASALAHGSGVALYGLLTVAGLAVVVTSSPAVFLGLQLAGAAYLVYLGLRALRSSGIPALEATGAAGSRGAATNGFLVAFLNPKLAVFMLALFSQFLRPAAGLGEKAVMVATVGLIDAAWYSLVVVLISRKAFLHRLRTSARLIDRCFGVILIVLALSVVLRTIAP
jgi:threonine/homoserine/homoserine lactone efflux protein